MASQEQAPDSIDINDINDEKLMDETVGIEEKISIMSRLKNEHWNKAKVSLN